MHSVHGHPNLVGVPQPCRRVTSLIEHPGYLLLPDMHCFQDATASSTAKRQGCLAGSGVKRLRADGENETFKTPPNNREEKADAVIGLTPPDPCAAAGESDDSRLLRHRISRTSRTCKAP